MKTSSGKDMDQNTYMVHTICLTYNHAAFIEEAFNGFTSQETTFPFVCCILDDDSTDGEQDVIKKYLQEHFDLEDKSITCKEETANFTYIFARHRTNHNCFFALYFLKQINKKENLFHRVIQYTSEWTKKSKYIAFCEGDDYWTDSKKLQKQVDFLESHPDYAICSHDFVRYDDYKKKFDKKSYYGNFLKKELKKDSLFYDYSANNYFERWVTQPLTCLIRKEVYMQLHSIPIHLYKNFKDDIFYYYVLKEGKGALLKDVMGVYRINNGGVWSSKSIVEQKKDVLYNAYNIYLVEGDEHAFQKMNRCEKKIVYHYFLSKDFRNIMNEFREYYKLVPLKHYFSFVLSFLWMILLYVLSFLRMVLSKIGNIFRRIVHCHII